MQAQLKAGQDIGRDIVTLTDWMAAKWVALGYCEQLDLSLLPNVETNLVDALKGRSIDPQNNHLVPWQSGFTGLAYNPELTGSTSRSVADLWNPDFKGKVTLLTEMRDTLGLVMLQHGHRPHQVHGRRRPERLRLHPALRQQRPDPPLHRQRLRRRPGQGQRGTPAWRGRATSSSCSSTTPSSSSSFPEKGSMLWTDNMMIPKNASHPYNAHLWMNFYYQPEIAAMVEDYVNYVCPVNGAKDALLKKDPTVANNPLIFPTQYTLDTCTCSRR